MQSAHGQRTAGYEIRSAYLGTRPGYRDFCIRATWRRADGTASSGLAIFVGETNGPRGVVGGAVEATLALFGKTYGYRPSLQRADIVDQTALVCLIHQGKAYEGRATCMSEDDEARAKAIHAAADKALQNLLTGRSVGGK